MEKDTPLREELHQVGGELQQLGLRHVPDVENVTNDVESVLSKKHRKSHRRHIDVSEVLDSELGGVLVGLRDAIRENTSYLRALRLQQGTPPGSLQLPPIRKSSRVTVELLVSFLHVIDVNTKLGYFHAELYVQAKWADSGLRETSQQELDGLDFTKMWKPDLVIVNAVGEPDDVKTWYSTVAATPIQPTMLYIHKRIRGQFKESLELEDFPVDKQDLTVLVSCERPMTEVTLIPNSAEMATVTLETFNDGKEFRLWDNVDVRQLDTDPNASDKFSKSSKVAYTCCVSRRPVYYFINGLLLQFLIAVLTGLVFVQDPSQFTSRASLAATLLLTSVAFHFTVLGDLPNIPYITYLGIYDIVSRMFQVIVIIESGIVYYISKTNKVDALLTDRIAGAVCAAVFISFNIVYLTILCWKYRNMYNSLVEKENEYKLKKMCCGIKMK